MKTRDAILEYQKTLDDTGTLIKDLTLTDPVSAFYLEFEGTNGATSNKGNFLSDVITRIEVVDGSTVLYSLSLAELEALQWYKTYRTPALFPSEWLSGKQRHGVYLLFGQYLWDSDFNMDFRRYKNPQLKITTNIAAIRAAGATGFLSGYLKATIVAKVMEGAPGAGAYLMAREVETFVSAASGEKRIELPTDYPYRMLMLRAWLQQSDIDEIISDVKLTLDTDKFIPFNRKVQQLDAEALQEWGVSRLKHDIFCSDNEAVRLFHNKEPDCRIYDVHATTPDIVGIIYQWSSEVKPTLNDAGGAQDTTDRNLTMVEEGHALHATLPITFGPVYDPSTWFDPKPYQKMELVLTQATASGACAVVSEQVKPVGL
jgi:hypothetical protein